MSYQCVELVLNSQLPRGRKLTLVALAHNANQDGSEMWAPVREIAQRASKGVRQVTKDLAWLEQAGIITEVNGRRIHGNEREFSGGRSRCIRYRLNLSELAAYRSAPRAPRGFGLKPRSGVQGIGSGNGPKPRSALQAFEQEPCTPLQAIGQETMNSTAGYRPSDSRETLHCTTETLHCTTKTLHCTAPDPNDPNDPNKRTAPSAPDDERERREMLQSLRQRFAPPSSPHAPASKGRP